MVSDREARHEQVRAAIDYCNCIRVEITHVNVAVLWTECNALRLKSHADRPLNLSSGNVSYSVSSVIGHVDISGRRVIADSGWILLNRDRARIRSVQDRNRSRSLLI